MVKNVILDKKVSPKAGGGGNFFLEKKLHLVKRSRF
jgi:hypothetical protein